MAERIDREDRKDREKTADREQAFDPIVHEYYRSVEQGDPIDRKEFIEKYPKFKEELESFFADLDHLGDVGDKPKMRRTSHCGLRPRQVDG